MRSAEGVEIPDHVTVAVAEPVKAAEGDDVGVEVEHSEPVGNAVEEALAVSEWGTVGVARSVGDALLDTDLEAEGEGVPPLEADTLGDSEGLPLLEGVRPGEREVEGEPPPPAEGEMEAVVVAESVLRVEGETEAHGDEDARESTELIGDPDADREAEADAVAVGLPVPASIEGVAHALMVTVTEKAPVKDALTLGEPDSVAARSGVPLTVPDWLRVAVDSAESEGSAVAVASVLLVDEGVASDVGD